MGFFALACKNPVTELPRTRWFSLLSAPVVPYTARRRPLIPSWTSLDSLTGMVVLGPTQSSVRWHCYGFRRDCARSLKKEEARRSGPLGRTEG